MCRARVQGQDCSPVSIQRPFKIQGRAKLLGLGQGACQEEGPVLGWTSEWPGAGSGGGGQETQL